MFVEGADTRNAEKIFEFVKKALLIITSEIYRRGSHGFVLSFEAKRRRHVDHHKTFQYTGTRGRACGPS